MITPVYVAGLYAPLVLLAVLLLIGRAKFEQGGVVLYLPFVPFSGSGFVGPWRVEWLHGRVRGWDEAERLSLIDHERVHDGQMLPYLAAAVVLSVVVHLAFDVSTWPELPVLAYWGGGLLWLAHYGVSGSQRMEWEADAYGLQFARRWHRRGEDVTQAHAEGVFRRWVPGFLRQYYPGGLDPADAPPVSETRIKVQRAFRREWVRLGHRLGGNG